MSKKVFIACDTSKISIVNRYINDQLEIKPRLLGLFSEDHSTGPGKTHTKS